jgi:D-tyrosyl-tRNA(Tyr) deacylase
VRLAIQRVSEAQVRVADRTIAAIERGLCVFLGIRVSDDSTKADYLADKLLRLRIFDDDQGKMNRSVIDTSGEILVVSQFTLYGDLRKGNRPSFTDAAPPDEAQRLYSYFVDRLRKSELKIATGQFQARMEVTLKNHGPVTFILEA